MKKNIGIILAGGLGTRFNGNIPKQYMKLNGKEMIAYSIDAFKRAHMVDDFICVVNEEEYIEKNIEKKYNVKCIKGGNTRNESLYNAIINISENFPDCEKVVIHEAARPFIKSNIIDEYLLLLNNYDAVITTVKITDSIGLISGQAVDREKYHLIQAPEAFWFKYLKKYFSPTSNLTATIHQLPSNLKIYNNYNFKFNLKVTYPEDLFIAEQLIKLKYFKKNGETKINDNCLLNKKVLIFGASGGVGSAIVKRFKLMGAELLCPTSKELNLEYITIQDIVDYCKGFKPDIIINAAAFSATDEDGLIEMFDKIFKINLKSNLVIIEYAKTLNKKVNIVLFSSSSSTKGRENLTLYSATKAGINSIVESLAERLSKFGIYINAIIPEKINTPMINKLHNGNVVQRELLDVDDIMDAVIYYSISDVFGELAHIRRGL